MRVLISRVFLLACVLWFTGCDFLPDAEVQKASRQYQKTQDMASLEMLHQQLKPGMKRSEVEALLGAAQYSPIDGIDYYSAEKNDPQQSGKTGLVVEYINSKAEATDQVQKFWLGEVGE